MSLMLHSTADSLISWTRTQVLEPSAYKPRVKNTIVQIRAVTNLGHVVPRIFDCPGAHRRTFIVRHARRISLTGAEYGCDVDKLII